MPDTIKQYLEVLRLLTTPERSNDKCEEVTVIADEDPFDRLLRQKLTKLQRVLKTDKYSNLECSSLLTCTDLVNQTDIRWNFTIVCLYGLIFLRKEMASALKDFQRNQKENPPSMTTPHQAPPLSPDVLSMEQEKTVLTTLQFIVCLGVCPNLDKGVGIPVERRSGFGALLSGGRTVLITEEERNTRLGLCGRVLSACFDVPSLGGLILSRHLSDLLAVLLQLQHYGTVEPQSESRENVKETELKSTADNIDIVETVNDNNGRNENTNDSKPNISLTKSEHGEVVEHPLTEVTDLEWRIGMEKRIKGEIEIRETDHVFGEITLQRLMTRLSPPLLVRDLVMLQGGAKQRPNVKTKSSPLSVSPSWVRIMCGRLMTDILMRPQGLLHVLQGMLPQTAVTPGQKGADTGDWQKCQAVAMVIAHCPMQMSSVEDYFKHICPQVLGLLHHSNTNITHHYLRVIVTLIKLMNTKQPKLVKQHLLEPMLKPLHLCLSCYATAKDGVLVTESDLSLCIQDIYMVYVSFTEAQVCLWPALSPFIPVIFHMYSTCKMGVSHLRTPCEEILNTFLKQSDADVSLEFLWLLATGCHGDKVKDIPPYPSFLVFQSGDSGALIAVQSQDREEELSLESRVHSLVGLMKLLQSTDVAGDFFIKLLKELTKMVTMETTESTRPSAGQEEKVLFNLEQQDKQEVELFNRRLITLTLLASLCEELDSSFLKKTQQILDFVKATLERGVEVFRASTEELTGLFESETLSMAMGLLTAVMGGAVKVEDSDRKSMEELLPLLDEIRNNHMSEEVREMADDLRIAIATRGAVWSELMKNKADLKKKATKKPESEKKKKDKPKKSTKPLIEVISETTTEDSSTCSKPQSQSNTEKEPTVTSSLNMRERETTRLDKSMEEELGHGTTLGKSMEEELEHSTELEQAFKELCDPEIPVRGHGLLRLNKLVQDRDKAALAKKDILLKVYEENLQHKDSYLYLASVNGLAALADHAPDHVVPRLAAEFADFDSWNSKKSPELRMKLGESLMKAAKNLGDMIPKYRDTLLSAILSGVRSDDAMVRASSLSNLAEVSRLLRFSLGPVIHEVFACCSNMGKSDPDAEVRKAAMLVITQLLQGLGADALKVLDTVLKDLYRLLKQVHTTDSNEMVRTHALLALNELDAIMKAALFPRQKLEKKISVLHPD